MSLVVTRNKAFRIVVSPPFYGPVIFLVKLALFLLYLHLFGRLHLLQWLAWGITMAGLFYCPARFIAFILCGLTLFPYAKGPKCILRDGVAKVDLHQAARPH